MIVWASATPFWPWQVHQFQTGLVAGAVTTALLVAVLRFTKLAGRRKSLPLGGVAFAAVGLVGLRPTHPAPVTVWAGVIGLGAMVGLAAIARLPLWSTALLMAPFGWLLGYHTGVGDPSWVQPLVGIAAVVGAILAADTDHEWRRSALGLPMLAVTLLGIYLTEPDTRENLNLLGLLIPLACLGWPLGLVRLGRAGAGASIGLMMWVIAYDGRGRPSSIIGAIACLGLLAALPVGAAITRRTAWPSIRVNRNLAIAAVLTVHTAVVFFASRVAGLRRDVPVAALLSVSTAVFAVVVSPLLVLLGRDHEGRPTPTTGRS